MDNLTNLPPHLQKKVDEAAKEAAARMEIEYELRSNPAYKEFFASYQPNDVEEFIKDYSSRKVSWINWGKSFYKQKEDPQFRLLLLAESCLWQIQQKKLFNLQCQWRAEKIKLPGVSTTKDFRYWEYNIKHCSFLPPITEWEFDLYMDYMRSGECEIDPWENDPEFEWQDYDRMSKDENAKDKPEELILPMWYTYYDTRMGTDSLMYLPDERGDQEDEYLKLYDNYVEKEAKNEGEKGLRGVQHEEFLSAFDPELIEKFVRKFEDKQTLKYFLFYHEKGDKPVDIIDELAHVAFSELREAGEKIPVRSSKDWREALIDAWEDYRRAQVIKLLPLAYDDYLQKQNLGITYEKEDTGALEKEVREWKAAIMKGMELSGKGQAPNP